MEQTTAETIDKSSWGDGPWQQEPDRIDWVHAGLACMILRHWAHGYLCGYVGVPNGHPAYGIHPFDLEIDVSIHWGLNYGAKCEGQICHVPEPGMPEDVWWLGFDCGHRFDLAPARAARERALVLLPGIAQVLAQLEGESRQLFEPVYRTIEYATREVNKLAEQLAGGSGEA